MFQPPKGTGDFLPEDMARRQFVLETIRKKFESYGFGCLETPAFEQWELLQAKCGADIKEQIFRFKDKAGRELGLRFDLTVPLARVIAANPTLSKPFKRYQIQPVWRYEEVTAGRKREFWQCDIDIVGTADMTAEAECLACAVDCLKELGFKDFVIKLNNRKILEGLLVLADIPKELDLDTFRAIDKLAKITEAGVRDELKSRGLNEKQINKLFDLITLKGDCQEVLDKGKKLLKGIAIGEEGLAELQDIFELGKPYGLTSFLSIDFSLARGLDYYTGPIFEITAKAKATIGAVAGGGRFDDLIQLVGGPPTPATGISLGIERIIEIMQEQQMFKLPKTTIKTFVAPVSDEVRIDALNVCQQLRVKGIACDTDLMSRKLSKQLEYASSLGIPYVAILGPTELKKNSVKLRDMRTGKEKLVKISELAKELKS